MHRRAGRHVALHREPGRPRTLSCGSGCRRSSRRRPERTGPRIRRAGSHYGRAGARGTLRGQTSGRVLPPSLSLPDRMAHRIPISTIAGTRPRANIVTPRRAMSRSQTSLREQPPGGFLSSRHSPTGLRTNRLPGPGQLFAQNTQIRTDTTQPRPEGRQFIRQARDQRRIDGVHDPIVRVPRSPGHE